MHTRNESLAALALGAAGLSLIAVGFAGDIVRPGPPIFGMRQLAVMVIGSLVLVIADWQLDHRTRVNYLCRGGALFWTVGAFLGFVVYPAQWSATLSMGFLASGVLLLLAARVPMTLVRTASTQLRQAIERVPRPEIQPPPTVVSVLLVGTLSALVCYYYRWLLTSDGDFAWATDTARRLLAGRDAYDFTPTPWTVPYPLAVVLFGLPFVALPNYLASALFCGVSAALLAYGSLRAGHSWRLLVFLSPPFLQALRTAQWSPLIMATWYFPIAAPILVMVKPQTALPVALARLTRWGLVLAIFVLVLSLAVQPGWPLRWLEMIRNYDITLPVAALPVGPLLLLSSLFLHDKRGRLLLWIALMPARAHYDLLGAFLVPSSLREMLALLFLSWTDPIKFILPATWPASLHFYALCLLAYSNRAELEATLGRMRGSWRRLSRAA